VVHPPSKAEKAEAAVGTPPGASGFMSPPLQTPEKQQQQQQHSIPAPQPQQTAQKPLGVLGGGAGLPAPIGRD